MIKTTSKNAKGAVIFLHGLGDSGQGWSWLPTQLKQSQTVNPDNINFVFPSAPSIPITANGGYSMPGWFDLYEFGNPDAKQDTAGILKSLDYVKSLIEEQHVQYKIPYDKIIVGGFSQGAMLSLAIGATSDVKLGGIIGLSGFLAMKNEMKKIHNSLNFDTPVYQGHGTQDPVIAFDYGLQTSEFYKAMGFRNWEFKRFEGLAHSASDEELVDVGRFIEGVIHSFS